MVIISEKPKQGYNTFKHFSTHVPDLTSALRTHIVNLGTQVKENLNRA